MVCHFFLWGIFLTQGLNLGSLHCWHGIFFTVWATREAQLRAHNFISFFLLEEREKLLWSPGPVLCYLEPADLFSLRCTPPSRNLSASSDRSSVSFGHHVAALHTLCPIPMPSFSYTFLCSHTSLAKWSLNSTPFSLNYILPVFPHIVSYTFLSYCLPQFFILCVCDYWSISLLLPLLSKYLFKMNEWMHEFWKRLWIPPKVNCFKIF